MRVKFCHSLFQNANGFCIFVYQNIDTGERITCKGNHLPDNKNLTYDLETEEVIDKKYGRQYNVSSYTEVVENSRNGIITYLSSGIIKGIGKKTAERIYEAFGEGTMDVLDTDIERLRKVKGISVKKLEEIKKSYETNRDKRNTVEYLIPFPHFTSKIINKILNIYGKDSYDVVKNRPYDMIRIRNVTFDMVDELARKNNICADSPERVLAAARTVLKKHMLDGHCAMDKDEFGLQLIRILDTEKVTKNNVCSFVVNAIKEKELIYKHVIEDNKEHNFIYLPEVYCTEIGLAKKIVSMLQSKIETQDVDTLINRLEKKDKPLDSSQRMAVDMAVNHSLSILTGGPGSGKTTTIQMIADVYKKLHPDKTIAFLAPTGRAARRITESTGFNAFTVHSYLGLINTEEEEEFQKKDEEEKIEDGLIIVDEVSMLDLFIASKLFDRIEDSQVVLVGDCDQLPSVGVGAVLRDLIACNQIPVTELKYSHRQADGSTICENAELIRQGITPLKEADDFELIYMEPNEEEQIFGTNSYELYLKRVEDIMVEAYVKDVEKYGLGNVACLCPYKEHAAGVHSMNKRIQAILNPSTGHTEYKMGDTSFRIGDLVMQLRNREEASNGDIGIIRDILRKDDELHIVVDFFHNESKVYNSENIEELTLAYALSVHKSQGSEYDSVITCLCRNHVTMLKRNISYTAFTRGKKKVRFIGEKTSLEKAIKNNLNKPRNTLLAYEIRELNGEWVSLQKERT